MRPVHPVGGRLAADVEFVPRGLDATLDVPPGEVLALIGPNGAGKSSLLAVLAGLLRPTGGRISLGDRTLYDAARRIDVPPHRRGIASLTQEARLFPHLDVRRNVAFGPRSLGRSRAQARRIADARLEAVGADDLADRRPAQLSGGQAARVALARALACEPGLVLLDEPFAALDVAAVGDLRRLVRAECCSGGRTAVVVTHDLLDVVALADRIAVVEGGRVVESGAVRDVLAAPRSAFAARFAGVNLVRGRFADGGFVAEAGAVVAGVVGPGAREADDPGDAARGTWPKEDEGATSGVGVAVFAPAAVSVHVLPPEGSPRNVWPARVVELCAVEAGGVRLVADAPGVGRVAAEVTAAAVADLALEPGREVYLTVKAREVRLHRG